VIGAAILGALLAAAQESAPPRTLDDFERLDAWTAHPADGVDLAIRSDAGRTGRAMRLDFAFRSGGGYAIARRALPLDLPPNYAFSFWIRGEAPPNTLEFKLIDSTGENVWWYTERDRAFDPAWRKVTIRRRQIAFAWGPRGGGTLDHVASLELVITAGRGGGHGSVWIDDLAIAPLPELGIYDLTPTVTASSSAPGHAAALLLDGDTATSWRAPGPRAAVTIDFLRPREYGGLTLRWETGRAPREYAVLISDDGTGWREITRSFVAGVGPDYLYLPDTESRYLRLDLLRATGAAGFGLRELRVEPLEWSASRNAFFTGVARDAPRGAYPRYFLDERADWTVVGVDGAREEALLSEDGALEAGAGDFSVEPFLAVGGRLIGWNEVTGAVSLADGRLPIPSVEWRAGNASLTVTAFAAGSAAGSSVIGRYRVTNRGQAPLRGTLYLAIRPFQVNPPWQFLGTPGGASRIASLRWDGIRVLVNGDRQVAPLTPSPRFGATPFETGEVVQYLRRGELPPARSAGSPLGAASGALAWPLTLAPGDSTVVAVEIPLVAGRPPLLAGRGARGVDSALAAVRAEWVRTLDRGTITLPAAGAAVARTITSTLGYILVNRDGPAIQPGSRSYERSWIRDGALTSAAMLRFGHADVVREFLLWYAGYQYPNGKVPCCVDRRGADPVPEHDSDGEFIYLVMEYYRHTGDRAMLERLWPSVQKAVGYLDSLRQTERTDAYRTGDQRIYLGLLPPSISHEGYSAKPMHSYWDDFFALRGFKDAAAIAAVLGDAADANRIAAIRDEFASDLYASLAAAMAMHGIDYIPGAADLGDFDATSTTIAVAPGGELGRLPRAALTRTFERYWAAASVRHDDTTHWEAYTPYELRTVGTFLRLGRKDRALALLDGFLRDQEPPGWNQWPEVVWKNRRAPKFIGDLPHTWVGSDFLRSAADLFVYERETDSTLVIGAGIPDAWLADSGVAVRGLSTWWGRLSYTARKENGRRVVAIDAGVRVPPGGLVVFPPGSWPGGKVTVGATPVTPAADGSVTVRALPARISFTP
jgi:F5/8 type C domain-containing protein/alpha-L-rhamnosidase-like protein